MKLPRIKLSFFKESCRILHFEQQELLYGSGKTYVFDRNGHLIGTPSDNGDENPNIMKIGRMILLIKGNTLWLSFIFVLLFGKSFAQNDITLDEMRQRYAEYYNHQPIDTSITRESDELVRSYYRCYNVKEPKYMNPRTKSPDDYGFLLARRLRTPEYPDRRHYWSLVEYERVNHRAFKHPHKRGLSLVQRWRWRFREKSFVRYLALDSVEGVSPSQWSKDFKRKYYHKKHKFHYAKAVSDSLFLLNEVQNMLGFTVAAHFKDVVVRRGHVRLYSQERCEEQAGDLMYQGPSYFGMKVTKRTRNRLEFIAMRDEVNSRLTVVDSTIGKKSYDLLIIFLPNRKIDIEMLSCTGEPGPEYEQLKKHLCDLEAEALTDYGYYVRYWSLDGKKLPGFFLEATINQTGTWSFCMDKFLLNTCWKVRH